MSRNSKRGAFLVAVLVLAGAVWAYEEFNLAPTPDPHNPAVAQSVPANPKRLLDRLVIAEEDDGVDYERPEWGEDWAHHGEGCNTRELVLLDAGPAAERGAGCDPVCPVDVCWTSPYDGRPTGDPDDLQIDHRVALSEAAHSPVVDARGLVGPAAELVFTPDQKHRFYEDRGNLVAATAAVNQGKGDLDPGEWKPGLEEAWCGYAAAWVRTKLDWGLTVDPREHAGLSQMLATCSR